MISTHLVALSMAAVLLFWAVGAYNRLVRLRSEALRAFALLEPKLQRYAEHAVAAEPMPAELQGAAAQFAASLAVARAKPLEGEAMAALGAACSVLRMAWQRIDVGTLPAAALAQWDEIDRQAELAAAEFSARIVDYNAAVGQFPAVLLAWLFGFRQARPLGLPRG